MSVVDLEPKEHPVMDAERQVLPPTTTASASQKMEALKDITFGSV